MSTTCPDAAVLPPTSSRWTPNPARDRLVYQPRADQLARGRATAVGAPGAGLADRTLPSAVVLLTPGERTRFDSVVDGACAATHVESVAALAAAMRRRPADGIVVSATALAAGGTRAVAGIVELGRAFATTPLVVLVSGEVTPAVLVALGRSGARAVLDVRGAAGWSVLQSVWPAVGMRSLAQRAAEALGDALVDASPGMRRFVVELFEVPPRVRSVRGYAPRFGVLATTLMSRFFRAGLPAPRRYLALARLVRAAQLFESPRWTVESVAAELEYSSAQAFSRHLYLQLSLRPREFRRSYDGAAMLGRFADDVLVPYREQLRAFEPF